MHGVVIDERHVLLKCMVHESDSVTSKAIVCWEELGLLFEPLDLISSHTVVTTCMHTVVSSSSEEPHASHHIVLIVS